MLFGTSHQGLRITPVAIADQLRRRRLDRAGDRPLLPAGDAVLDQRRVEGRHVDDDIFLAELARQPAPAVHVEPDAVDLRRCRSWRAIASAYFSDAILRMRRQQAVAARRRRGCVASAASSIWRWRTSSRSLSTMCQLDRVVAADMAERQVRRNLVEALGRRLGERHRIAGPHRQRQPGGIIVVRGQPLGADAHGCRSANRWRPRPARSAAAVLDDGAAPAGGGSGASDRRRSPAPASARRTGLAGDGRARLGGRAALARPGPSACIGNSRAALAKLSDRRRMRFTHFRLLANSFRGGHPRPQGLPARSA